MFEALIPKIEQQMCRQGDKYDGFLATENKGVVSGWWWCVCVSVCGGLGLGLGGAELHLAWIVVFFSKANYANVLPRRPLQAQSKCLLWFPLRPGWKGSHPTLSQLTN